MPALPTQLVDNVTAFFDTHREQLTRRSNGMMERLYNEYCALGDGRDRLRLSGFKRMATQYRNANGIAFIVLSQRYVPKATPRLVYGPQRGRRVGNAVTAPSNPLGLALHPAGGP